MADTFVGIKPDDLIENTTPQTSDYLFMFSKNEPMKIVSIANMPMGNIENNAITTEMLTNNVATLAKLGIDVPRIAYGATTAASDTVAKLATIPGFTLVVGSVIGLRFRYGNTSESPTLNVNSTGAKAIYYNGYPITTYMIPTDHTALLQYNGTQWLLLNPFMGDVIAHKTTIPLDHPDGSVTPIKMKYPIYISNTTDADLNTITGIGFHGVQSGKNFPPGEYTGSLIVSEAFDGIMQIFISEVYDTNTPARMYVRELLYKNVDTGWRVIGENAPYKTANIEYDTGRRWIDGSTIYRKDFMILIWKNSQTYADGYLWIPSIVEVYGTITDLYFEGNGNVHKGTYESTGIISTTLVDSLELKRDSHYISWSGENSDPATGISIWGYVEYVKVGEYTPSANNAPIIAK